MARTDTQLTKQIGEYLVAAELARRGLLSATFSGSVRHYDIIASGPEGGHIPVQVKTIARGAWQLDIRDFTEISMSGRKQILGQPKPPPYEGLTYVFVALGGYGSDRFFIVDWEPLTDLLVSNYARYLAKHGGQRPKNPSTFHTALPEADLAPFQDNWDVITRHARHAA